MAEYPGDATQEEIEKKALREFKAQLVGVSGAVTVPIDSVVAAKLVELLPSDEALAETEEEKQKTQLKAAPPKAEEEEAEEEPKAKKK